MTDKTFVTRPSLPPLEQFIPYLQQIWDSKVLTNGGPFHQQLEAALAEHLGLEHVALFNNGTIALITALQALRVTGEVITTPFSFVATANSLLWNGIRPVFVDIDPVTLNIDPRKVEAAITPHTTAILPVHCFGNVCDVEALEEISARYNLRVIYDAAHAFDVAYQGKSVLSSGDLSVLSFHATKVFHTFEGGAIVCPDAKTKKRIDQLKNFGFVDEVTVVAPGINGKMSEVNAAFGLLQLQQVRQDIARRQAIDALYRELLAEVAGVRLLASVPGQTSNYSYFPILVEPQYPLSRDALYDRLKEQGIFSRRYFYPLISDFPMYRGLPSSQRENLPVASQISPRILCLPIYPDLQLDRARQIAHLIAEWS